MVSRNNINDVSIRFASKQRYLYTHVGKKKNITHITFPFLSPITPVSSLSLIPLLPFLFPSFPKSTNFITKSIILKNN
ncbi:transmembrane protein, putative [Medicago truncatula]|uniref:Transmembrane protein, putative n=1 Tax=Medicago truncatula TaxID=3880 RepID=G7IQV6_MEDTR|nr:transmembrane protein, putative [Medicago truncatula]